MPSKLSNGSNHHTRNVDMSKVREVQNREAKAAIKKHGGDFAATVAVGSLGGPVGAATTAAGYIIYNTTKHVVNTWTKNF